MDSSDLLDFANSYAEGQRIRMRNLMFALDVMFISVVWEFVFLEVIDLDHADRDIDAIKDAWNAYTLNDVIAWSEMVQDQRNRVLRSDRGEYWFEIKRIAERKKLEAEMRGWYPLHRGNSLTGTGNSDEIYWFVDRL